MDDYLCTQVDETIIFAVYMELIDIFSWSHPDGRRVREVAEEKAIERLDKDHPLGRQRLPRILREIYSLYYSIKIYEAQGEDCRWFLQNPDTDILNRPAHPHERFLAVEHDEAFETVAVVRRRPHRGEPRRGLPVRILTAKKGFLPDSFDDAALEDLFGYDQE